MDIIQCTAIAPSNLACIKYWGKNLKVKKELNLPINSSVSITLDYNDELKTTTTIVLSKNFKKDRLFLNGIEEDDGCYNNKRVKIVLNEMRKLCKDENLKKLNLHIISENSFPTAAGLASSAAGYACMVTALSGVYNIDFNNNIKELSMVARQGSGSATRSLLGGFVKWNKGIKDDGTDSYAIQIAKYEHWKEMEAIILVVNEHKKEISSTNGMTDSVNTSLLLNYRAENIVEKRLNEICEAYKNKDFNTFALLTMKDSNQFHATCLDTYPPIFYLNDVSKSIIQLIHKLNNKNIKYCYTFDAGPNAVIFTLKENTQNLLNELLKIYCPSLSDCRDNPKFNYVRGRTKLTRDDVRNQLNSLSTPYQGKISYIYHTGVGKGSRILSKEEEKIEGLADKNGYPKKYNN